MEKSNSIQKISAALVLAQKEFKTAIKKSVNPYFRSKYANYTEVLSCVKEALNNHGISILQPIQDNRVETILLHESGEYISSYTEIYTTPTIIKNRNDEILQSYIKPQDYGSAITYARRYALSSLLSIDSDEDDDGNIANGNTPNQQNNNKDLNELRMRVGKLLKAGANPNDLEKHLGYSLMKIADNQDDAKEKLTEFENQFFSKLGGNN